MKIVSVYGCSAPESLQLFGIEPFYNEGATVYAVCRNRNQRPGFRGDEVWTNFIGGVIEGGTTLMFKATRELAGQYICSVPTVPEIMPFVYDIVIRCKLWVGVLCNGPAILLSQQIAISCHSPNPPLALTLSLSPNPSPSPSPLPYPDCSLTTAYTWLQVPKYAE